MEKISAFMISCSILCQVCFSIVCEESCMEQK